MLIQRNQHGGISQKCHKFTFFRIYRLNGQFTSNGALRLDLGSQVVKENTLESKYCERTKANIIHVNLAVQIFTRITALALDNIQWKKFSKYRFFCVKNCHENAAILSSNLDFLKKYNKVFFTYLSLTGLQS